MGGGGGVAVPVFIWTDGLMLKFTDEDNFRCNSQPRLPPTS